MMWPDCSPPSERPSRVSTSSTNLSPTSVSITSMPLARSALNSPRLLQCVTTTLSSVSTPALEHVVGQDGQEEVAVEHVAGRGDGHDAVGVAVEREAEVEPFADDLVAQVVDVGRTDAVVDVLPVGLVTDDDEATGLQLAEQHGGHGGGRAVCAVDPDGQPAEIDAGDLLEQVAQVGVDEVGIDRQGAMVERRQRLRAEVLVGPIGDGRLLRVGQLETRRVEELEAVVVARVVRGGHAAPGAPRGRGHERHRRGGGHADLADRDAQVPHPRREGLHERLARLAGVPPDHEAVVDRAPRPPPGRWRRRPRRSPRSRPAHARRRCRT